MKPERKTVDEWHTQGDYGQGWETVTIDETYKAAQLMLGDYRRNETRISFRVKKFRVKREGI